MGLEIVGSLTQMVRVRNKPTGMSMLPLTHRFISPDASQQQMSSFGLFIYFFVGEGSSLKIIHGNV